MFKQERIIFVPKNSKMSKKDEQEHGLLYLYGLISRRRRQIKKAKIRGSFERLIRRQDRS